MQGNRRVDTMPERRVRSALHRRGLRFRKDFSIKLEGTRVRPDIVFTRARIACFIDGCYWHRCPAHGTEPKSNSDYWGPKLDANVRRDRRNDAALREAGWWVIRAWEHEDAELVADRIAAAVPARASASSIPASRSVSG
jgi:DNA mismatch endonuclease (patch repair protein)